MGVTPFTFQNVSRRRVSRASHIHQAQHATGAKLSVRGGFTHRFPSESYHLSTPLPWLLCVFRIKSSSRYHEVGPASPAGVEPTFLKFRASVASHTDHGEMGTLTVKESATRLTPPGQRPKHSPDYISLVACWQKSAEANPGLRLL